MFPSFASKEESLGSTSRPAINTPISRAPTLLLVDDEPVGNYPLRRELSRLGYTVQEATTYDSAARFLAVGGIQLVVLDGDIGGGPGIGGDSARLVQDYLGDKSSVRFIRLTAEPGAIPGGVKGELIFDKRDDKVDEVILAWVTRELPVTRG